MTTEPAKGKTPTTIDVRVQCDSCNGVHHLYAVPHVATRSTRESTNMFLECWGWEVYEDGYRHRCSTCVTYTERTPS